MKLIAVQSSALFAKEQPTCCKCNIQRSLLRFTVKRTALVKLNLITGAYVDDKATVVGVKVAASMNYECINFQVRFFGV